MRAKSKPILLRATTFFHSAAANCRKNGAKERIKSSRLSSSKKLIG
jgi:hypothetical protein